VARAQSFDPCTSYPGDAGEPTEILNAGLEMPVPDTGNDWIHVHGSQAHINRDQNALDLNENDTQWDFDHGLPALAAAGGIVRLAGLTTCRYGYSVVVEHTSATGNFYTHYAHLHEALMVVAGQSVVQRTRR
jgi:murein DD-endopeptidase MepM/ murein hydrolase activator NlpD